MVIEPSPLLCLLHSFLHTAALGPPEERTGSISSRCWRAAERLELSVQPPRIPLTFRRCRCSLKQRAKSPGPSEQSVHGLNGRALPALTAPSREVRLSVGWLEELGEGGGPCQHLAWFSAKF